VVPFLEKASLEEPGSSLIDMWASLLVSASDSFESYHTHFVSIIAQLSSKQGDIFMHIIRTKSKYELEIASDNIRMWYIQPRSRAHLYRELYDKVHSDREQLSADDIGNVLLDAMNNIAVDPVHLEFEDLVNKQSYMVDVEWSHYNDRYEVDYAILDAVGLIRRVDTYFEIGEWQFWVIYYHLTELGYHFALSCGIVSDSTAA